MAKRPGATKIQGAREFDRLLRQLPRKIGERTAANAVRAGAKIVRDAARELVPVDSGELRDNVISKKERGTARGVTYQVGPSRKGFYGMFLEFGTSKQAARPWLRPAFDRTHVEALSVIGQQLGKSIERAATRLAGPLTRKQRRSIK